MITGGKWPNQGPTGPPGCLVGRLVRQLGGPPRQI